MCSMILLEKAERKGSSMSEGKRPAGKPRGPNAKPESLLDMGRHPVELILGLVIQLESADTEISKPMGDGAFAAVQLRTVMENMKLACTEVLKRLEEGTYVAYLEDHRYRERNVLPIQAKEKR